VLSTTRLVGTAGRTATGAVAGRPAVRSV